MDKVIASVIPGTTSECAVGSADRYARRHRPLRQPPPSTPPRSTWPRRASTRSPCAPGSAGITVREGMLIEGPAGWGEFCPFPEYGDAEAAAWLAAAVEQATRRAGPLRCATACRSTRSCRPSTRSGRTRSSPGRAAAPPRSRSPTTRASLRRRPRPGRGRPRRAGPGGAVRVDANGAWDVDTAVAARPGARPGRRRPGVRRAALPHDRRAGRRPPPGGRADRRGRVDPPGRRPAAGGRRGRRGRRGAQVHAAGRRPARRCGSPRRPGCRASCRPRWRRSVGLAAELALAGALPELAVRVRAGDAVRCSTAMSCRGRRCVPSTAGSRSPAPPRRRDPALLDAHAQPTAGARARGGATGSPGWLRAGRR